MKYISCFVSMLIFGLMTGCAGTLPPKITSIDTLQPGKLQVRKTGEPMLERGVLKVQPGFKAKVDTFLPKAGDILLPSIKRGDVWECSGKATDPYLVCGLPARIQNSLINEDGTRIVDIHKFAFKPWGELVGVITPTGRVVEIDDARKVAGVFEPIEIPLVGSQKTELIYDGRFDDVIKITYLEFGSDFTKPTYFKGLSYNVSSLNLINIKEMMIEVVEANENEIKFIVRN
jgi:hypothetical protein